MKYSTKVAECEETYEADSAAEIVQLINAVESTKKQGVSIKNPIEA